MDTWTSSFKVRLLRTRLCILERAMARFRRVLGSPAPIRSTLSYFLTWTAMVIRTWWPAHSKALRFFTEILTVRLPLPLQAGLGARGLARRYWRFLISMATEF